ncbi:MAG TPA: hypothetical protein VF669_16270 [Tepidisphaeraceae bacterium]|jgi:hypothetical protein
MRSWVLLVACWLVLDAPAAQAQKTILAPPVVHDLGVANVRLEMYGWEEPDRKSTPSPGLFAGDGSMRDQLISGRYQMALAGRWPGGSREAFGFVGGPYPNESNLFVLRFTRTENNIDVVLKRSDRGGKGDGYRSWKIAYLSALLPADLPDGKYSVQCIVQDEKGQPDPMTRTTAQCDVVQPNPQEAEAKSAGEELAKLADEELVRAYLESGRGMGNAALAPREVPVPDLPAYEYNDVKYLRFMQIGDEIVRRGSGIVPWLMAALERQAPLSAQSRGQYPFGFARVLMDLLVRINDPRPALLLVDLVDGLEGKATVPVRACALDALEKLTMVTFRRHNLNDGRTRWAVEDPRATPADARDPIFGARGANGQAPAFRAWLSREGRTTAQWLAQARARAREALAGRDLRAIYGAVDFLQHEAPQSMRDDQPLATMRVVGGLLDQARQVGFRAGNYDYQVEGRLLPLTIDDWFAKLAYYGPRARPWAAAMIRIDGEITVPSGKRAANLARIGGEETVAYFVGQLPDLERRLTDANLDLSTNADLIAEERQKQLLLATQETRRGIARWTGQHLENPQQLAAWWEKNRIKSQGTWLRESLWALASRADGGDAAASKLLRVLLPELPNPVNQAPTTEPSGARASALQWLNDNQIYLSYDDAGGCFRLDPRAFP